MKTKSLNYFKIKVAKPLSMSKAKKLKPLNSTSVNGYTIYSTVNFNENEELFKYLKELGCAPENVSKLSLQSME